MRHHSSSSSSETPGAQEFSDQAEYLSRDTHELLTALAKLGTQYHWLLANEHDRTQLLDVWPQQLAALRELLLRIAVEQQPQEPPC
jgi:hypothetical protein